MKNYVFFGTGDRGKKLYKIFHNCGIELKYWIDSDKRKWGTKLEGKIIFPPSKIQNVKNIQICISAMDMTKEMYHTLLEYKVPENKIFSFFESIIDCLSYYLTRNILNKEVEEKQNIIFDCYNGLVLGGVEAWSKRMVFELRRLKYMAYLFSPYGDYYINNSIKEKILWFKLKSNEMFAWENLEYITNILYKKLPYVFISSFVNDALLAACSVKKNNPKDVRIIGIIHQGELMTYKEYFELNSYIDKYIAVSKDIQEDMIKMGIEKEKVLHMTCPVDSIEPYIRSYSLNCRTPIKIGYAGRIEKRQKRMDCLAEVIKEMEKSHTNYQIEIAGTGSYLEKLAKNIREYGLESKVHLIGEVQREKISYFWSRQDICINLSEFEGRSISIMEAMKNGAIPIVTDTSGVREDIEDGISGFIVPIGDYEGIGKKINYLSNHRELLSLFGTKARAVMEKKNNMDTHIEFWNQVLHEMR